MWVLLSRLWGSQVFACSEEPTILRGRPQLTNTTGVRGCWAAGCDQRGPKTLVGLKKCIIWFKSQMDFSFFKKITWFGRQTNLVVVLYPVTHSACHSAWCLSHTVPTTASPKRKSCPDKTLHCRQPPWDSIFSSCLQSASCFLLKSSSVAAASSTKVRSPGLWSFFKVYFIKVYLIYDVVLISVVQQSDSVIQIHISSFRFFSIIAYYRILNIIPYITTSSPCCFWPLSLKSYFKKNLDTDFHKTKDSQLSKGKIQSWKFKCALLNF